MKLKNILFIAAITGITGAITFAYFNQWFFITFPQKENGSLILGSGSNYKKMIILAYAQGNQWHSEQEEAIWQADEQDNAHYLINRLLSFLQEEDIIEKKVVLQTALISTSKAECYLSFDRSPLRTQWSLFEKWMLIEGILKALRDNGFSCQKIYFLVRHKPLLDDHLDFSNPWPLEGFYEKLSH